MRNFYLAGKISKNDWRHSLVPGLRDHIYQQGAMDCDYFRYCGPFFVGCDHGGFHGRNRHGCLGPDKGLNCCDPGETGASATRRQVIHRCMKGIDASDVVLAYITAPDCHGTVAEIQYAIVHGKEVVVAFAPGIASEDENDFWFISKQAHRVEFNVDVGELEAILRNLSGARYGG